MAYHVSLVNTEDNSHKLIFNKNDFRDFLLQPKRDFTLPMNLLLFFIRKGLRANITLILRMMNISRN